MPVKIAFILTTYSAERPWIVESTSRDSVELETAEDFWPWATATWPAGRHKVQVEPGQGPLLI